MTTVADVDANENALAEIEHFYNNLGNQTVHNWKHRDWPHPYCFKWGNDLQRGRIVNWLCEDKAGKIDLPVAHVLQWLLYKFRVSQRRKRVVMGASFDLHLWTWEPNAKVMGDTNLTEKQLRRAVGILEERGLIRVVRDCKLSWVPHYRPSADLFRLCQHVTRYHSELFNQQYIDSFKFYSALGDTVYYKHDGVGRELISRFARDTNEDRFANFVQGWNKLDIAAANEVAGR